MLCFVFVLGFSGCGLLGEKDPTTPPANVTGLAGTPGDKQVELSWNGPLVAGGLGHVEVTWTPGGTDPQTVNKGIQTYTAKGLTNGTAYTFTVKAVDTAGNMSTGATVTKTPVASTPDTTPPANVTGLAGTPGDKQVVLSWTDPADADLASIEITWTPGGATPQTVNKGTGTYTATDLTNGTEYTFTVKAVDTAENRNTGATVTKTPVAPGTPVDGASGEQNIKLKFEGSKDKTEKAGVEAAFLELSAFIKNGGLTSDVIQLGNYIDLEGGLEIADDGGSTFSSGSVSTWNDDIEDGHGKLSRLIVVGINSFNDKNGNGTTPHVVFQFQNITHDRQMNATGGSNGGYPASDMKKYVSEYFLAGLIDAGVPDQVLWPPARMVQILNDDATDEDSPLAQIEDTLWLPTAWEMTGSATTNVSEETVGNQARLEYYASHESRVKYDTSGAKQYWLASTCSNNDTVFASTKTDGNVQADMGDDGAETPYGVAPAFCVKGWLAPAK